MCCFKKNFFSIIAFLLFPFFIDSGITIKNYLNHTVCVKVELPYGQISSKEITSGQLHTFFNLKRNRRFVGMTYIVNIAGKFLSRYGLSKKLSFEINVENNYSPLFGIKSRMVNGMIDIYIENIEK